MTPQRFESSLKLYRARKGRENRASGEAFEFEVLKDCKRRYVRKKSDFAIRSAGSHSIIDILVRYAGKIVHINCKRNGYREQHELETLRALKATLAKNEIIILANRIGGRRQYIKF